jgi:hypothetical protein
MSDIDKDFEEVVNKINAKLAEAGAAVAEANRLAQEAGIASLTRGEYVCERMSKEEIETFDAVIDYIDVGPLEGAMESAGWSTSSWYC